VDHALALAYSDGLAWTDAAPVSAPQALLRAADLLEQQMPGTDRIADARSRQKRSNAIAEVREAVDFLRYYAQQASATALAAPSTPAGRRGVHQPLEFSVGHFRGPGFGRAGGREPGSGQTSRTNPA
jgi:RHH-type proline utilization regulon transcriptional repressor/proline dehydrogenase/delta 1-pyrroline-5-carboxylate dehydrogenase